MKAGCINIIMRLTDSANSGSKEVENVPRTSGSFEVESKPILICFYETPVALCIDICSNRVNQ